MGKPRSLRGKVVVVTGRARGIGAKTAAALARQGANVAIVDLDEVRAEKTAGQLGGILALALDVTDAKAFTVFLDVVETRLGPIDVLVNNAGIMPLSRSTRRTTPPRDGIWRSTCTPSSTAPARPSRGCGPGGPATSSMSRR
jgi:NAD(P)-dependent dehydrogenase (short-subunit alcohol dehydrogenase family)